MAGALLYLVGWQYQPILQVGRAAATPVMVVATTVTAVVAVLVVATAATAVSAAVTAAKGR